MCRITFQRKDYIVKLGIKVNCYWRAPDGNDGAGEDRHRRKYANRVKERLVFFRGDLGKCTAGPGISWFCEASFCNVEKMVLELNSCSYPLIYCKIVSLYTVLQQFQQLIDNVKWELTVHFLHEQPNHLLLHPCSCFTYMVLEPFKTYLCLFFQSLM